MYMFDNMDMTASTYSLLKDRVPATMDAAGMSAVAELLRESDPIDYGRVAEALRSMPGHARAAQRPERCVSAVEDVAFWAEAAVWASYAADEDAFRLCVARVTDALEEVWSSLELH
jgi:hypothetical protein